MVLNVAALWKQEARDPSRTAAITPRPSFREAWHDFNRTRPARAAALVALGLGTVAFSMQDVLLEPYGGQVLHLTRRHHDALTALLAAGGIARLRAGGAVAWPRRRPLSAGGVRRAGRAVAFSAVIFAAPLASLGLFAIGVALIGFGAGLFAHCTLTAAMGTASAGQIGLALGAGAPCRPRPPGRAVALGGLMRDGVSASGDATARLGEALRQPRHRLFRRLPHRDRAAVRHAGRPRAAGPSDAVARAPHGRAASPTFRPFAHRAEVIPCKPAPSQATSTSPSRAVCVLALLRRADLLPAPRGQARGLSAGIRPSGRTRSRAFPRCRRRKKFILPHGGAQYGAARWKPTETTLNAAPTVAWPGAPLEPTGDPMLAEVGPAAYAKRADVPDACSRPACRRSCRCALRQISASRRTIPIRAACGCSARDGLVAGHGERYLGRPRRSDHPLSGGRAGRDPAGAARSVLVPMAFVQALMDVARNGDRPMR